MNLLTWVAGNASSIEHVGLATLRLVVTRTAEAAVAVEEAASNVAVDIDLRSSGGEGGEGGDDDVPHDDGCWGLEVSVGVNGSLC
jgi:hypothetical protein